MSTPTTTTQQPTDTSTSIDPAADPSDLNSVTARGLCKSFDGVEVVHGLDIDVEPGKIVGLIGPSGCGKTTTVRLMTGLLAPTSGEVRVGATDATALSAAQRARIGYLPQTPALFPDLSLMENLSFHASMYGLPFRRKQRLHDLLDWVELLGDAGKRVSEASGGMQRRLALAAAFVHDPDIVFLDEPTAGIDPILREKFWNQFRQIASTGKTLVVTTQYVGEAGMCDTVGLLSDGELLLMDTPANLRRAAFDGQVVDVTTSRPITADELDGIAAHDFVIGIERTDVSTVRVVVDDAEHSIDDVNRVFGVLDIRVVDAEEHEVDYDEAFVQVVQRHRSARDGSIADDADDTASSAADPTPHDGADVDASDLDPADTGTSDGGAS